MITNDQIYSAITGFNPTKLQALKVIPSGEEQVFDVSGLLDGNIGYGPVTVSPGSVSVATPGFITLLPYVTNGVSPTGTIKFTVPGGIKMYFINFDTKELSELTPGSEITFEAFEGSYMVQQPGLGCVLINVLDLCALPNLTLDIPMTVSDSSVQVVGTTVAYMEPNNSGYLISFGSSNLFHAEQQ